MKRHFGCAIVSIVVLVSCGSGPSGSSGRIVATVGAPNTAAPAGNSGKTNAVATSVEQTVRTRLSQTAPTTSLPISPPTTAPSVPSATAITPTSVPTATPAPKPGDVLYQADWSNGANGWAAERWTYIGGMMAASYNPSDIFAPYQPPTIDYTLTTELQALSPAGDCIWAMLIARYADGGGLNGGISCPGRFSYKPTLVISTTNGNVAYEIEGLPYQVGNEWHTYTFTVKGNMSVLSVDGRQLLQATDNTRLKNGRIGISCGRQCNVRSFKVSAA